MLVVVSMGTSEVVPIAIAYTVVAEDPATLAMTGLLVTKAFWFLLQTVFNAHEAVMVEVPGATAVTRPELLTVATAAWLLFQVRVTPETAWLGVFASMTVADIC